MSEPTPGRLHFDCNTIEAIWATPESALYNMEYRKVFEQAITACDLERTLAAQRTALLALSERIRREGMQGVANSIEEICK